MRTVQISGVIVPNEEKFVYDFFGMESTCPKDIKDALAIDDDDITIMLNSGGGDVFSGNEIFYMLHEAPNNITVDITGFAGSAATVICCAADKVRAVPSAMYMIHNVASSAHGDYHALQHEADVLMNANKGIANAYMSKTGMAQEELLALMDKETWMDAREAKEKGFIDEIIGEDEKIKLINSYGLNGGMIPQKIINQMMEEKLNRQNAMRERLNTLKGDAKDDF